MTVCLKYDTEKQNQNKIKYKTKQRVSTTQSMTVVWNNEMEDYINKTNKI